MYSLSMKPKFARQQFLWEFMCQLNEEISLTNIQKLVFLNMQKAESPFYEFIPYMYGCYSFQLKEDLETLVREGFLSEFNSRYKSVHPCSKKTSFDIASERGNALICKVYKANPYYVINSEIAEEHLSQNELDDIQKLNQSFIKQDKVLFTIGYEGKSVEKFVNMLIVHGIQVLCDVRKNAFSYKFGFSKSKLCHIVESIGIQYLHIPELGIESDKRKSLNTLSDYQELFKNYSNTLSMKTYQVEQLYSLLCSKNRIALMCFELESKMCHRHVIRDYLQEKFETTCVDL